MKKVGMSVSLSLKTVVRIEEYIEEHGGSFSGFIEDASIHYLDRTPPVVNDSIPDSKPDEVIDIVEDTPKDIEVPPVKDNVNGGFNWDGINMD